MRQRKPAVTGDPHRHPGEYLFCPMCRGTLEPRPRAGLPRMTCPDCGWVHFRDPAVGVAVLVRDRAGRILLVQRASRATQAGRWCLPCGFMDYGEEVRAAAARELAEETGLACEVGGVLQVRSNVHDPAKLTVGIWFEGTVTGGRLRAGDDAADARFFEPAALPDLAFEGDRELLEALGLSRGQDGSGRPTHRKPTG